MREITMEIKPQPKFVEPLDIKTGKEQRRERRKNLKKGKKKFGY